jgi:hypothetical protein
MKLIGPIIVMLCILAFFVLFFYGMYSFLGKIGVTIFSILILTFFIYGFIKDLYYNYLNR